MTLRNKRLIINGISAVLIHFLLSCQTGNISGGLETTNGFIIASNSNGTISGFGKPGTRVTLCDNTYIIQDSAVHHIQNQTIDDAGAFTFDSVPAGTYNLFCWDDNKKTSIGDIDSGPIIRGYSIPANEFALSNA